jgi:eukaryotic-like serine/threonine-protein kinase
MILERLKASLAGRYRIERELGQGGMATVYLAEDLKHDRKVAIKVLRPELAAVIGAQRFLAEIKTTANLQHPHILPLHDSGEVNGTVYYVMPFVEGESLRDRLTREKQLSIAEVVRIATEVAGALDYAHRHRVIHRDIKPENILLHDGQALVVDFGIALAVSKSDGGTRMTETGMSLGTPHYMSPEQAMGERDLDARTDVYALGCVAYEMLVGEPPFSGPTAQAIIAKVMTERPTAPSATRDTVPEGVEDAVLRAISKLPVDRFATAAEFAASLAGAEDGRPRHRRASLAQSRTDRRTLVALAVLAALLAVVAFAGWSRVGRPTSGDGPLAYQIHLTLSESDVGFVAAQLALSADGRVIVFSDTAGGTRQLWVKERGVAEPRPIPGTQDGEAPFLSPDGRTVAYAVGAQLLRIPISGGAPQVLSDSAQVDALSVRGAWLDNGMIVFLGGTSKFLYAVPDTGGVTRRIATVDQLLGFPVVIAAVPGHDAVIVTGCDFGSCTNPIVDLVQLESRAIERILPGSIGAWPLRGNRLLNILPDGTVFLAPFDPATGRVGEGTPVAAGIAVAERGPELAVGSEGVILEGVGGAGSFSNRTQLVVVGLDGSTRLVDSSWSGVFANNSRLDLSPDGRRILFSLLKPDGVETALFVKPYPEGAATRFSAMGVMSGRAVWSPDGQRIAWVVVGEDGKAEVWQQAADGSGRPAPLVQDPRGVYEVEFSPDGKWLLYRTDDVAAGSGNIYARRTSGDTTTIPVATSDAEETSPAISPDGHRVAYAARIGAIKEIIVRPFPEVDAGRVQVSHGGGTEPLWSHDGGTLYYRNPSRGQILAARMGPRGDFPGEGRRVVFQSPIREYWDNDDTRQYSLTPDGKGFLLMRRIRSAAGSSPMHLILREHVVPSE